MELPDWMNRKAGDVAQTRPSYTENEMREILELVESLGGVAQLREVAHLTREIGLSQLQDFVRFRRGIRG